MYLSDILGSGVAMKFIFVCSVSCALLLVLVPSIFVLKVPSDVPAYAFLKCSPMLILTVAMLLFGEENPIYVCTLFCCGIVFSGFVVVGQVFPEVLWSLTYLVILLLPVIGDTALSLATLVSERKYDAPERDKQKNMKIGML